jgi:hypothetical protein
MLPHAYGNKKCTTKMLPQATATIMINKIIVYTKKYSNF